MMLSRLSILIVTYRRDDLLDACLASIRAACPVMPQTVVVDNGDTPETQAVVQAYDNTVYIRSPGNPGFAGGNNIGLPACSGEYVLLLNNDTVVREEPFTYMMRYMDEHPEVAVVQGRMTLPSLGGVLDDCGTYLTPFGVQLHNYLRQPDGGHLVPAAVFSAKGACLLFRREIIERVGGFLFHGHFGSYYEETDFCHRVWLAGQEVHFVPSPPVAHLWGATSSAFNQDAIWRGYLRNMLFSFLTLFGARGLVRILPGFAMLLMAQVLLNLLKGRFAEATVPFKAIADVGRDRRLIRECRREAQARRVIGDKQLFRRILRSPSLLYYYYSAQNKIEKYKNPFNAKGAA